jgi:hypothetical protein
MNKLFVGLTKTIEPSKRGLFIHDKLPDIPRARIFDPTKHSFNPLKGIEYRKARALADVLYAAAPQGENTLTVRNGKRALLKALLSAPRLDKIEGDDEVTGMIGDLLQSPVLKSVLCKPTNFSFSPNSLILARLNRAELGDFDALILTMFSGSHCLAGAGGFEPRYGELESNALVRPRGAAEPLFVEIHKSFETLEFREPYRICGVQSFGEKWAFRRIMSAPCRAGVRSSNEKSLPLLGLISPKLTRRVRGFGQDGGGRGTGIEPSPSMSA